MSNEIKVNVPDIGGATNVDVIEILVKAGDLIKKEQSLITLEGDKATMEIPSPASGIVDKIVLKVGDKVSQGDLILSLKADNQPVAETASQSPQSVPVKEAVAIEPPEQVPDEKREVNPLPSTNTEGTILVSAGPAVRRMARELGVNLEDVNGSGRKSRITIEDLQAWVKNRLKSSGQGFSMPEMPAMDFSKFGEIEIKPLNKIKRLTGSNLQRAWITVPLVTQFDEADITELEAFRKVQNDATKDYKLTLLAFVTKIVSHALNRFPQFNSSLDYKGENLIVKKYINIGIAVETPQGLVVPVIKNVSELSISEIAIEMTRLSQKARDKGLGPADMTGGTFTISSLGGIGGTAFTPIVNTPEVAILGLSKSSVKPVFDGKTFIPRLMLPLSLSYDHRVVDGAEAARFTSFLVESIKDLRKILL